MNPNMKEKMIKATKDLVKIRDSDLMPSQKLDAIRVFLIPRFSYLMQNSSPRVEDLAEYDRAISFAVKKICKIHLHGGALPYIYSPISHGGLGIPCVTDEYMLYSIVTVYKSLINKDPRMQSFGIERLKRTVEMWSGLEASPEVCGDYLSHRTPAEIDPFYTPKYTYMGNLSRYRNAVKNLGKLGINFDVQFSDTYDISLKVITPDQKTMIFDQSFKGKIFASLRNIITENYFNQLITKYPNQVRMMHDISQSKLSNQFVRDGRYINSSSFRFVHRARLNLLPIGGTPMEPLLKTDYGNFQPDLLKIDEQKKSVVIFDLIISQEAKNHLCKAFEIKREKYTNLAISYSNKGYTAKVMPIVLGQLGKWSIESEKAIEELGISSYRQTSIIRKMIITTLNSSKDIYYTHLLLPNIHKLKVVEK
uniref:Uncharacterized protein n=1 Tax=Panagrolaimus sp. ES5 TaxID=591445 RepID=A0AC34G6P6_9BILA